MTVTIYTPDGDKYNLESPAVPRRNDLIHIKRKGTGTVDAIKWAFDVSTDSYGVVLWLRDWRPQEMDG